MNDMNKNIVRILALCLLATVSLMLVGCEGQPTAEEITAKMKEVEAGIEDAHAVVEFFGSTGEGENSMVIEVWEKKPDKYRAEILESSDPEKAAPGSVMVNDGEQTWIYDPAKNRVLVGDAESEEGPSGPRDAIRFMDEMIQRVLDTSDVELVGEEEVAGTDTYKLELTRKEGTEEEKSPIPLKGSSTLWVDKENWIILRSEFKVDGFGESRMSVRSFEFNTGLSGDIFVFEVPEGAEVKDMEKMRPRHIDLEEARELAQSSGFGLLVPAYAPEGSTLVDVLTADDALILSYDHSETSFTVIQKMASDGDTEEYFRPTGQESEVTVRGQTGTLVTDADGGNNFLRWTENGVVIVVAGHVSAEEVLKVAESLE